MSRRPPLLRRGKCLGRARKMVSRPSGSEWVVTSPRGLLHRNSRVRVRPGNGWPSTAMRSRGDTLRAGDVIALPLTETRPASIHASASRREASPARAITLALRSPSGVGFSGMASRRHARPCAGHPRLYTRIGIKDVDGRDKPGHEGFMATPSYMQMDVDEARAAQ